MMQLGVAVVSQVLQYYVSLPAQKHSTNVVF